jgi:PKD repeat protein
VSHTYTTPGQWFASLTVTDDDGAVDVSSQFVITITEPAPGAARSSSPGGPDLFT